MLTAHHRSHEHLARTMRDERRGAPRLMGAHVPWIRSIKPNVSGSAVLLNISQTGVLVDTRDRLAPGRRTTVVAADDQRTERLNALVVRTFVVSIAESTGVVYRSALEFEREFPWALDAPDEAPAETAESSDARVVLAQSIPGGEVTRPSELMLAGPVEAFLSSDGSSQVVSLTALTETGCVVHASEPVKAGAWVSIAVLFTDAQLPLLTGRTTHVGPDGSAVVRFVNLAANERLALRAELRRVAVDERGLNVSAMGGVSAGEPVAAGTLGRQRMATVHAAQW